MSLTHAEGFPVVQALMARGIHTDFRAPNTLRLGLSPLFLSYTEVFEAMEVLKDILAERLWDRPEFKTRSKVT